MGHADKIHRDHYRMPVIARDIDVISRLLEHAQGDGQESSKSKGQDDLYNDEEQTLYTSEANSTPKKRNISVAQQEQWNQSTEPEENLTPTKRSAVAQHIVRNVTEEHVTPEKKRKKKKVKRRIASESDTDEEKLLTPEKNVAASEKKRKKEKVERRIVAESDTEEEKLLTPQKKRVPGSIYSC